MDAPRRAPIVARISRLPCYAPVVSGPLACNVGRPTKHEAKITDATWQLYRINIAC